MKNQVEKLYQKILSLFKEHKRDTEEYKKSVEKLIQLTENQPEFVQFYWDAKFRLAKFYQQKQKFDISEKLFLELINNTDNQDFKLSFINELALDLRKTKQFEKAIFWYEEIIKLSPSGIYKANALEDLAKCYGGQENHEKERAFIEEMKKSYPSEAQVIEVCKKANTLRNNLLETTNEAEKNRLSDEIIDLSKFINDAFYVLTSADMKIARSFFNEGKYQECKNHIAQILDFLQYSISDSQDYAVTNAHMLLGETYFMEKNFQKAREYFEPIANTPTDHKYFKYKRVDINKAKDFLKKMEEK